MSNLVTDVRSAGEERGLWPGAGPVVVGVSGGADSVVLLHVLHRILAAEHPLIAVHVNYGLRPGADGDEALVRSLCESLGSAVSFRAAHPDMEAAAASSDSLQEVARNVRYRRFREVAEAEGATRVAVAHHRADQAETLLLRLFRGTGPVGLAGMKRTRPLAEDTDVQLIRPLLATSQAAVHAYADEHGLSWREDPTNTGGPYARAKLRTEVLPAIESAFPGATGRIAHAADLLGDVAAATLEPERKTWYERIVRRDSGTICLDESALRSAPRVWAERVVLDAVAAVLPDAPQTSASAHSVYALLDAQVGTCVELAAGVIWRERGALRLVPERAIPVEPIAISAGEAVETPYGTVTQAPDQPREAVELSFEPSASSPTTAPAPEAEPDAVALLDTDQLPDSLILRTWREGDRLQPLGMSGTKTVADVLTDAKIPPHRRARTLVVAGPDHVVWIPGIHLDHRQRIRPETERVTRFTFTQPDSGPGEIPFAGPTAGRKGEKGLPT